MGLDMYAYVATRAGQQREFWDTADVEPGGHEFVSKTVERPRQIMYWRKHPNLHGWFKQEWESAGNSGTFNGVDFGLAWFDPYRGKKGLQVHKRCLSDNRLAEILGAVIEEDVE